MLRSSHQAKNRAGHPVLAWLQRRLCTLVAVAGLGLTGIAQAQPDIAWYIIDSPPQYIVAGPHKGEGFNDFALQFQLFPALAEYKHSVFVVPMARRVQMLKYKPNSCSIGMLHVPEREQYMTFSIPFRIGVAPGIFVRRSDEARVSAYLDETGRLSLERLLADGKLNVGMDYARSYGPAFDGIVSRYKGHKNLVKIATSNSMHSLVMMATVGRLDAVPAYPFEATYYLQSENAEENNGLKFYPLADLPAYDYVYVACAKNKFGNAVIEKINEALMHTDVREAIARYYESWLDDESRKTARILWNEAFPDLLKQAERNSKTHRGLPESENRASE